MLRIEVVIILKQIIKYYVIDTPLLENLKTETY